MSDAGVPRDILAERIRRLSEAVADMGESRVSIDRLHLRQVEEVSQRLDRMEGQLDRIEATVREIRSDQVLMENRIENAVSRALRAHLRMDDVEDENRRQADE